MSESGYQTLDLDNPGAVPDDADFEIVHEELEDEQPEAEAESEVKPAAKPEPAKADDEDEDEGEGEPEGGGGRRKLTRSQRLKSARDAWQQRAIEAENKLKEAEAKASKYESDASEGAAIGLDLYIQTLDDRGRALRADYNAAFDAGDRDKIWEIQQAMAELAADKKLAEKERRAYPQKRAPSGGDVQQETQPTTARQTPAPQSQPPPTKPSPEALEWYNQNKDWFNKDPVMTQVARIVDSQMVQDGFSAADPDYFDELDKRLRAELPHKFQGKPAAKATRGQPTIQTRAAVGPTNGKVQVKISQADREMANRLGVDIVSYAREKAKRELAMGTPNQYTEIL